MREGLTSYPVGSCSGYKGTVLTSGWYISFGYLSWDDIWKWSRVIYWE